MDYWANSKHSLCLNANLFIICIFIINNDNVTTITMIIITGKYLHVKGKWLIIFSFL